MLPARRDLIAGRPGWRWNWGGWWRSRGSSVPRKPSRRCSTGCRLASPSRAQGRRWRTIGVRNRAVRSQRRVNRGKRRKGIPRLPEPVAVRSRLGVQTGAQVLRVRRLTVSSLCTGGTVSHEIVPEFGGSADGRRAPVNFHPRQTPVQPAFGLCGGEPSHRHRCDRHRPCSRQRVPSGRCANAR